jgi:hypothetical protein
MMPLPTISPPEHYSADAAYRLLRPIRPALEAARGELVTGINARRASLHFGNLGTLVTKLNEALVGGTISGSAEWTATANAVLAEVVPILMAAQPIEKVYAKRVGEEIAADADLEIVTGLEEAQNATLLDQEHIDTMRALVDAVLA